MEIILIFQFNYCSSIALDCYLYSNFCEFFLYSKSTRIDTTTHRSYNILNFYIIYVYDTSNLNKSNIKH